MSRTGESGNTVPFVDGDAWLLLVCAVKGRAAPINRAACIRRRRKENMRPIKVPESGIQTRADCAKKRQSEQKDGRQWRSRRPAGNFSCWSAGHFFQLLRVHIEVGVDVLHIVVVLQYFEQAQHLVCRGTFKFGVGGSDHCDLG